MEDQILSRSLRSNSRRDNKRDIHVQPDSSDNTSPGGPNNEQKGPLSISGNNSSCSVVAISSSCEERAEDEKSKQLDGPEESSEFKKQALDSSEDPEEDESDDEEEDVKVCDICGDAGREDLLAVCSRCTDGAEHTYCMRDMLDEVPEHDWLCEECKLAEEMTKRKLGSSGTLAIKEGTKEPSSDSVLKMDKKDLPSSRIKADNTSLPKGIPSKRPADSMEIESVMKKQNAESTVASPSTSSSSKNVSLSRENSFRSSDKINVKQASGSMTDNSETIRSPKANLPLAPTGNFVKSNSFGTSGCKPKVKPVDEVLHKNKEGVDGSGKVVGKSTSFKGNLNRTAAAESKVKMLSPEDSHILESRGLKQAKDRSLFERKNSLKLDSSQLVGNAGKLQARGEAKKQHPGFSGSSSFSPAEVKADVACKETLLSSSSRLEGMPNHTEKTLEKSYKNSREGVAVGTTSGSRRLKEGASEENKLKAAIHAAMQKKLDMDKKNRISEKSNPVSVSNKDSFAEPASNNMSNLGNPRNISSAGTEASLPRSSLNSCKEASQNNSVQSKSFLSNHVLPSKERDLNSYYDELMLRRSVIPEQDSIWQGSFEVHRNGITMDQICGFQAHLATTVSYKVSEIAKKFPQKVTLAEVPRLRTWPTQFKDSGADEDNIAVYFFAKDLESYQKSYKYLLEKMMKDDLALIGNIDGCELLIFSSKHLTEKSQRWNMLFFLWGVFRGRRSRSWGTKAVRVNSISVCEAPVPMEMSNHPSSTFVNGNCGSKDLTALCEVTGLRHNNNRLESQSEVGITTGHHPTCVEEHIAECQQAADVDTSSNSEVELRSRDQVVRPPSNSREASLSVCGDDLAGKERVLKAYEDSRPGACQNDFRKGESRLDNLRTLLEVKQEKDGSRREDECMKPGNYQGDQVKREIDVKQVGAAAVVTEASQTNSLVKNLLEFPNNKCIREQLSSTSASTVGRLPLNDLNEMDVDEEDMTVDMDLDEEDEKCTDTRNNSLYGSHGSSIFTEKVCSSMPLDHISGFKQCYDQNRAAGSSAAARFLFSADSLNAQSTLAESLTWRVSSSSLASGNDRTADGLPSLELALGAENKRPTLPVGLFLSSGERDQNMVLPPPLPPPPDVSRRLKEGEREGGTAALSLSLAFPFSDKDRSSG